MYKNDNLIAREGCSEALLRMVTEGRGNMPLGDPLGAGPSCEGGCSGTASSWGLHGYPLASVYSPLQSFEELYDLDSAHKQGTIFKKLDLDFQGRRIGKGGKCFE